MSTIEITIGWTRSDMENGYSSFMGYKPGASQHTETITVEADIAPTQEGAEQIAEACFTATNAPFATGLAAQIAEAIAATGYRGREAHYSLSVGDTVTVGEIMLACARFGFERVTPAPAEVSA